MNNAPQWAKTMRAAGGRVASGVFISDKAALESPVDIADNVLVYQHCSIGRYTYVNVGSILFAKTALGRYCSIGRGVELGLAKHPIEALSTHPFAFSSALFASDPAYANLHRDGHRWNFHEPTTVGSDVWIGNKAMVSTGLNVGHGAVVAAGAVVTKDVAPYSIVGGVPAKHLKFRFEESVIADLLDLAWWDMSLAVLDGVPFFDVKTAIQELKRRKALQLQNSAPVGD